MAAGPEEMYQIVGDEDDEESGASEPEEQEKYCMR